MAISLRELCNKLNTIIYEAEEEELDDSLSLPDEEAADKGDEDTTKPEDEESGDEEPVDSSDSEDVKSMSTDTGDETEETDEEPSEELEEPTEPEVEVELIDIMQLEPPKLELDDRIETFTPDRHFDEVKSQPSAEEAEDGTEEDKSEPFKTETMPELKVGKIKNSTLSFRDDDDEEDE